MYSFKQHDKRFAARCTKPELTDGILYIKMSYLHSLESVSFAVQSFQQLKAPLLPHVPLILTGVQVHCIRC